MKYVVKQFEVDAVQLKGECTIPNTANPDQPITGQAGDWLIIMHNGHQAILPDERFHEAYEPVPAPKSRRTLASGDGSQEGNVVQAGTVSINGSALPPAPTTGRKRGAPAEAT